MKFLAVLLTALGVLLLVATFTFGMLQTWTAGPDDGRWAATAGAAFMATLATGLGAMFTWSVVDERGKKSKR